VNSHILPALGGLPLRELSPETITGWRADIAKKGLVTESERKALKLLRGVLQRGVEWKRIPDNPARLVKLPKAESRPEVRPLLRLDHAALSRCSATRVSGRKRPSRSRGATFGIEPC
jgi:hypothetical protein